MRDAQVIIERIRRASVGVQRLDIAVDAAHRAVQPGQHFLARVTESWDPYLREPWIPIRCKGNTITIERPANRAYQPGQIINLFGPIGKPLLVRDMTKTLLLVAYDSTPASLLMLAEQALAEKRAVVLALIGEAGHYPLEALPPEIEVVRGDDKGDWPTRADHIRWADQVVAVAPPPHDSARYRRLLEAIQKTRSEVAKGFVYGLFQPPMPCGVGACQACFIRCHHHEQLACMDGPAFDLLDVSLG